MSIAYLVLVLDVKASPPVILGASIFSESQPTFGRNRWCLTIRDARADDYDAACAMLMDEIESGPWLAWVKPIFRNRDGSNHFAPDAQTSDSGRG